MRHALILAALLLVVTRAYGEEHVPSDSLADRMIAAFEKDPRLLEQHAEKFAETGDPRAGQILLEAIEVNAKSPNDGQLGIYRALATLKYKPAAPILATLITTKTPKNSFTTKRMLEALRDIGEESVILEIERFRDTLPEGDLRTAATRVLLQLAEPDPVPKLLALYEKETYKPEKSDILMDVARYQDDRAVPFFRRIASESDSGFLRREAIGALEDTGTRKALLTLVDLLAVQYSNDLTAEWGWKGGEQGKPDFEHFFPEYIHKCLQRATNTKGKWTANGWRRVIEKQLTTNKTEQDNR